MSGPAYEFQDGITYEEAVAGLVEAIRQGREDVLQGRDPEPDREPRDVAFRDQFAAAHDEQIERLHAMGALMGHPTTEAEMSDDVMARCTLAWLACHACPHIKKNPAQPMVALLAIHRLVCERCTHTVVKPPAENDDRCDWCWSHGHTDFWPIRMSSGPTILIGDACDDCNAKLKAPGGDGADV